MRGRHRFLSVFLFLPLLFGAASLAETSPAVSSSPATVSPPPVKSTAQAAQDLKRDVPLDLSKLGDPLPRNLFIELSKLINPTVVSITTSTLRNQAAVTGIHFKNFSKIFGEVAAVVLPAAVEGSKHNPCRLSARVL